MKFAAGFQYRRSGELFCEMLADYQNSVEEVYFALMNFASGRPDSSIGLTDAAEQLVWELKEIRAMSIKLDLLINGNCYGAEAISENFKKHILDCLNWLAKMDLLPEIVTTTSPFAAAVIREAFPQIELRMSVNMRVDSLTALEYMAEKFDSFYLRRDLQRDLKTVEQFAAWSKKHNKKLCLLANSGCLRNCPYQTFHDNLVAHDSQLRKQQNVQDFMPHLCWERYREKLDMTDFLRSSWIRPEDVKSYEPYCKLMKLATRQHSNPRLVLAAYCSGKFDGNVLDLTEPCFSEVFAPQILDNRKLDAVELPGLCGSNCTHCGKCQEIIKLAVRTLQ